MPVIQTSDTQYKFYHKVSGNDAARRKSLKGPGPILVGTAHVFHSKLPTGVDLPACGGGNYEFTQHKLEYIMLDSLTWSSALQARNMVWVLSLTRAANFLAAVVATGKFTPLPVSGIDNLKLEFAEAALLVPDDQKLLGLEDVISFPEPQMLTRSLRR